jgi:uncharacterized protein YkwD
LIRSSFLSIRSVVSSVLLLLVWASPAVRAATPTQGMGPTLAEQYLLSAANQERAARGLPPVRRDVALATAALAHARQMAAHATIAHQFAGEPELASRASSAGVRFSVVEENVGQAPSVLKIHELWMHSPHHRDNLLDPSIDSAGISVVSRNGELYAVEDFAKSVQAASFAQQEYAIAGLVAQRGVNILSSPNAISAARETCRLSTGYAGETRPGFVVRFTSDSLTRLPSELSSRLASGRFRRAAVGACPATDSGNFAAYSLAVMLYP